ncbi:MAB_1171c family putative transporter [Streptomyces sp. NPDC001985]|uniref:MAB_1171c family putative transporter n=1 Tax=Streptomyces sp. NPDC001985 TaxID=3154406 RepID=UPI00332B484C
MSEAVYDVMYLTVSFAAYSVCLIRLLRLRLAAPAPVLLTTAALFWGATAFLFAAPTVYRAVGEGSGHPNLAVLCVYVSVIVYGGLAQAMALMWKATEDTGNTGQSGDTAGRTASGGSTGGAGVQRPAPAVVRRIRRRLTVYGTVATVLGAVFLVGRPAEGSSPTTFDTDQAGDAPLLAFLLFYQAAWFAACLYIAAVCRRHLRRTGPGETRLRRGLRCVAAGTLVCAGYGICKLIAIAGPVSGLYRIDVLSDVVGPMAAAVGAVLIVIGFFYPVIGKWLADRRDYRLLAPLWETVVRDHNPRHVLAPANPVLGRFALGSTGFLLTRRIIEITDAQRSLHPYRCPAPAEAVLRQADRHLLAGPDLRAAQEAADLLVAVRRAAAGETQRLRRPRAGPGRLATDDDARVEREHLVRIARHLDHPAVLSAAGPPG